MTSWINIWNPILINRSNRPVLQEDEHNIYIRDNIGLYQGKSKILNRQNGRIYLTNKRIIYFDNEIKENSIAVNLADILKSELVEGFLRSSPKVKLYLKENIKPQKEIVQEARMVDWVCMICSFNNQILIDADLDSEIPKCVSCGIIPSKSLILKAKEKQQERSVPTRDDQCPKCTFINHPSMRYCEICGSELKSSISKELQAKLNENWSDINNALNIELENNVEVYTYGKPYIKLSFRKGGELEFYELFNDTLNEIKWENLKSKGTINKNGNKVVYEQPKATIRGGGIHGLEQISEQQRKQNEIILSSSLNDLEQLMYKHQDLIKLSNSFSKLIKTKPVNSKIIPPLNINKSSKLYHKELARHLSEYMINYELTRNFSMITSQDFFASYNRYLTLTQGFGTELISSCDFNKSIELFEILNLPINLINYEKSGLVVFTPKTNSNYGEFIINFLIEQEKNFKYNKYKNEMLLNQDNDNFLKEEYNYFKGNTISEISDEFNWSYNITVEELEKCVEDGSVVIDQNISGTFYFINKFSEDYTDNDDELLNQIKQDLINEQINITENLRNQFNAENGQNLVNLHPEYTFGIVSDSKQQTPKSDFLTNDIESETLNDLQGLKI